MIRTFKSVLPVDLPFIRSGQMIELETDEMGVPKDKEARKRYKDGGIIEVKIVWCYNVSMESITRPQRFYLSKSVCKARHNNNIQCGWL